MKPGTPSANQVLLQSKQRITRTILYSLAKNLICGIGEICERLHDCKTVPKGCPWHRTAELIFPGIAGIPPTTQSLH